MGRSHPKIVRVALIYVKPVPEPSTIGGIAVAGLLGIWLKKKKAISEKE
ncbi:PEP-CTERM sorting domain-containing protein [Nostoc sp. 'Peltigera malacea cyanobiont' DB3992]|nr:PEP-CTERM sorting domain-containing protein [Nostoc sp. 'Peltigera malacea cyanobiont' DB3992]PHM11867.1 hypothetical protein CK516_00165 [Nostoc sp. 'Peltigera malacea cyanobiont' DB3992]